MTNAEQSKTVKTAFILSLIAGISLDALFILYFIFGYAYFAYLDSNLLRDAMILGFIMAPIVLGIIALTMINQVKDVKRSQRVYLILTRIFSITSIAEGAFALSICSIIYIIVRPLLS